MLFFLQLLFVSILYPFTFLDASSHLYKRVRPSARASVRLSVRPSVRNALFSNPRKRLFSAAEMDGIELVVTRGEEGRTVVTRGSGGDEG